MPKNEIKRDSFCALIYALKGKYIWYFLKHKFFQYNKFIIFPMEDQEYNMWGIAMLQTYLKKEKLNNAVAVISNKNVENAIRIINMNNIEIQFLKPKYINYLMKYYALVNMSKLWAVVSVTMPYDTGAEKLIGIKGITKKEIVYYDIYGFSKKNIEAEIGENIYKVNEIRAALGEQQ